MSVFKVGDIIRRKTKSLFNIEYYIVEVRDRYYLLHPIHMGLDPFTNEVYSLIFDKTDIEEASSLIKDIFRDV